MLELVLDAKRCSAAIFPKALLRYPRKHSSNNSIKAQTVLSLYAEHSIHTRPPGDEPMIVHRTALGPTIMGP